MVADRIRSPYDDLIDYLVERVTPEEMLAYQASEAEQARADELTEKNKDNRLTAKERKELAEMLEVEAYVVSLKARALARLHGS